MSARGPKIEATTTTEMLVPPTWYEHTPEEWKALAVDLWKRLDDITMLMIDLVDGRKGLSKSRACSKAQDIRVGAMVPKRPEPAGPPNPNSFEAGFVQLAKAEAGEDFAQRVARRATPGPFDPPPKGERVKFKPGLIPLPAQCTGCGVVVHVDPGFDGFCSTCRDKETRRAIL